MAPPQAKAIRRLGASLAFVSLALASSTALAQSAPPQALDRASIWVGGYYAKNDTKIGAGDRSGQYNGKVDLEDDLGFREHKTVPRVRADFLIGDHQGLSVDYYSVNRSRSRSISRDIFYGGNEYDASARVKGKLDFDFGSAAYRFWFGQGSDAFGLGIGGAYYRVHARISGEASLNGDSVGASTSTGDSAWAPLAQLGWRHAFNDQWRIYVDASGVKKNGGSLHGHIYNADAGLEWFPWQNVGFGAEYDFSRIKLHQSKRAYSDELDMKLDGPSLYVRFRF